MTVRIGLPWLRRLRSGTLALVRLRRHHRSAVSQIVVTDWQTGRGEVTFVRHGVADSRVRSPREQKRRSA